MEENAPQEKGNIFSYFFVEKEISDSKDDMFNFNDKAETFSKNVINNEETTCIVYGIDSPWGSGKSSFLQLCRNHWTKAKDETILFEFNPLRYDSDEKLLLKFIEGLSDAICHEFYIPELRNSLNLFAKEIQSLKPTFSLGGFNLTFGKDNISFNSLHHSLEQQLYSIDEKVIVIIDDLDRLEISKIKEILFLINKCFNLPNLRYILCYDTINLNRHFKDRLDTNELNLFFEKFIHIKFSLYIDKRDLDSFISNIIERMYSPEQNNFDPLYKERFILLLKEIQNIIGEQFSVYENYLGDARKLKRIINIIMLLEISSLELEFYDFDTRSIINLILIYINHPEIFRKLANGSYNKIIEDSYIDFHEKDKDENLKYPQRLLYRMIGSEKRMLEDLLEKEGVNGHLQRYCNLITKRELPKIQYEEKYLSTLCDKILNGEHIFNVINEVIASDQLENREKEIFHRNIWNSLVRIAPEDFSSAETSENIIFDALELLDEYSLITDFKGCVGLRSRHSLVIAMLISKIGWTDSNGNHTSDNQNPEDLIKAAQLIFNENGILDWYKQHSKNILGLYDLLIFRQRCQNRESSSHNLNRALFFFNDISGDFYDLDDSMITWMRNLSQKVFRIFNENYISSKRNIFSEVDSIGVLELTGISFQKSDFEKCNEMDNKSLNTLCDKEKARMIYLMINQLATPKINNGVIPCGYYDMNGEEDKGGIHKKLNEYLFGICFNPIDKENIKFFARFLLTNAPFGEDLLEINSRLFHNEKELTKFLRCVFLVFDKEIFLTYWKKNKAEIMEYSEKYLIPDDKKVIAFQYEIEYSALPFLFQALDKYLEGTFSAY